MVLVFDILTEFPEDVEILLREYLRKGIFFHYLRTTDPDTFQGTNRQIEIRQTECKSATTL